MLHTEHIFMFNLIKSDQIWLKWIPCSGCTGWQGMYIKNVDISQMVLYYLVSSDTTQYYLVLPLIY